MPLCEMISLNIRFEGDDVISLYTARIWTCAFPLKSPSHKTNTPRVPRTTSVITGSKFASPFFPA